VLHAARLLYPSEIHVQPLRQNIAKHLEGHGRIAHPLLFVWNLDRLVQFSGNITCINWSPRTICDVVLVQGYCCYRLKNARRAYDFILRRIQAILPCRQTAERRW
jgi:hypothetical protein